MRVGFFPLLGRAPQDQDHEGGKKNQPQAAEEDGSSPQFLNSGGGTVRAPEP